MPPSGRADRLALALWWLIESVAREFDMPPEHAANEVAMLCGLAKDMSANTKMASSQFSASTPLQAERSAYGVETQMAKRSV
jgi:hypothetical protein